MYSDKYQAVSHYVFVVRDPKESEKGGIVIPDSAQKKPNTGTIISVGHEVVDPEIKLGRKAVFHKAIGGDIELPEITLTVLNGNEQILGVYDAPKE